LRAIPLSAVFDSIQQNPSPHTTGLNMVHPALVDFLAWNNSHPFVVTTNFPSIPQVAFNFLPKYDG